MTSSPRAGNDGQRPAVPERRLSLLLLLVAAHQRMAQLVDRELAANGVAADGYATLSLIGVRGSVRLTEVASELGMPLTTASDIVRRLEARGHVRRRQNPDDRRSWLFALSAAGDREWRRGWGALQRINDLLEAELGDPAAVRESLGRLGSPFAAALEEGRASDDY